MKTLILFLALCGATGLFIPSMHGEEPPHTRIGNLEYRFTFGDLPYAKFMPGRGRSVLIIEGGRALLEECLNNPDKWAIDSDLEKILHPHPFATISCRELGTSPILHLRYVTSTEEFSIHFDKDGPRKKWRHLGEIVRNVVTLGQTNPNDIYLELVKKDPSTSASVLQSLTPTFDTHGTFHEYLHDAFLPEAFAETISESAFVFAFHTIETGNGHQLSFEKYLEYHAIDSGLQHAIGAATAIGLRQDVRFKTCNSCSTFGQRLRHALLGTLLVDGYDGQHELAFSRVVSAFVPPYMEESWLSSTRRPADPLQHVGNIFLGYAAESAYVDFVQPTFRHFKHKLLAKIGL